MKNRPYSHLIVTLLFVILATSCLTPSDNNELPPSPPSDLPAAIQAARQTLAQRLGVDPSAVFVISYQPSDWPDSCLGWPGEGEICAQVITPGYGGELDVAQELFRFRVDERGQNVRLNQDDLREPIINTPTKDNAGLYSAYQALTNYLTALLQGRYAEAASLFGGDVQVLRDNNPQIPADDLTALFEAACTINGFLCQLSIKKQISAEQISETRFRFVVELQTLDGELFTLGPCCGANPEEEPPLTQFEYFIEIVEDAFLVMNLPVYVP